MHNFIYGVNTCKQYLKKNKDIKKIFLSKTLKNKELITLAKRTHKKIEYVSNDKLDSLTKQSVHQGIVVEIEDFKYYNLDEIITNNNNGLIVVLDGINDPQNLGAILRTCDACGVDGVVIGKHRCAKLNATVAKVSTGAIETVKVVQVSNITKTLKKLKENGYWVVGSYVDDSAKPYNEIKYDFPTVLVIGNEGEGISNLVKKECDFLAYLPMKGKISSLNASVATGVFLYQILLNRQ